VTLRFVGDVALGGATGWRLRGPHLPMVANIEGPVVADVAQAATLVQPYSTRGALAACFGSTLAVACVANNHAADLGETGLAATIDHLESLGATVVGTPFGGRPPCSVIMHEGRRVAIVARVADESFGTAEKAAQAAPLVYRLDPVEVRDAVRSARAVADRVVVLLHWGQEWLTAPSPERIVLARALVADGADLVVGHHAHVTEAWEEVDGRTIAYGLGTLELRFPDTASVARTMPRDGKRRAWWTRSSLAVDWSAASNEAQVCAARWDGGEWYAGDDAHAGHRGYLAAPSATAYRAMARKDYWKSKLRTAWQERIVPRPSHLRSLAGVAAEARRAASGG
jgi:hypothetical protein